MQFLKNLGSGGLGAAKAAPAPAKTIIGARCRQQKQKPSSNKQNSKNKKTGPPKGFIPQKYALDFNPPCIILQYRNPQNSKLYHHKMKIKKLKKQTSSKEALDYLKKKHYHYFMPKIIDQQQIEKLIQKLKNGLLVGQNKSQIENVDEDDFELDYDDDFED